MTAKTFFSAIIWEGKVENWTEFGSFRVISKGKEVSFINARQFAEKLKDILQIKAELLQIQDI